jgi:RNA-directed DNA polymerase
MLGVLADRLVVAVTFLLGAVGTESRGRVIRGCACSINQSGRSRVSELKPIGKPFDISKQEVWEAYLGVKANGGAPGVDEVDLKAFESDLKNNLYKVWNRMSSGSYFPPPVRAVEIPKPHGGGTRILGVPTISDRIAQTVVARRLGAQVESVFHPNSYGYRPGRSALDAVAVCRERCWSKDWVIDLDVEKFFDSVPWDLVVKAVEYHTDARWVVLYVKRWLAAPIQLPDGTLQDRDRGTPQGSAVSPVLANLFMHYAFDVWLEREFPTVTFERYADDAVVHCVSLRQARTVLAALEDRMAEVGLRLHPTKTRIVYCRDENRKLFFEHTAFTFLGFTFRARKAIGKGGKHFASFQPAVSKEALKKISGEVRSWRLHRCTGLTWQQIARWINPKIRGWMSYYGAFYRTALYPTLQRINAYLLRWMRRKYRRLRSTRKSLDIWWRITTQYPRCFAHWTWTTNPWRAG